MSKYCIYIVTCNRDHHYPVIMANNGKAMLNEPVKRAGALESSARRLWAAMLNAHNHAGPVDEPNPYFTIVRITEKDFRAKFPQFAKNAGPKKKRVSTALKIGDTVKVNAGVWGVLKAVVTGKGMEKGLYRLVIVGGKYANEEGVWMTNRITKVTK